MVNQSKPGAYCPLGTFITTKNVSATAATINLSATIENNSTSNKNIKAVTTIYSLDENLKLKNKVAVFPAGIATVKAGNKFTQTNTVVLKDPLLWGPPPAQKANMYAAVTRLYANGILIDEYETPFGIRSLLFDAEKGLLVNNQPVRMQGVNQHHDLGALGGAFNYRAAERQLQILKEAGCNAIRLAHNPPAPELLELTDRMGFLVIDEIFDSWERKKNAA